MSIRYLVLLTFCTFGMVSSTQCGQLTTKSIKDSGAIKKIEETYKNTKNAIKNNEIEKMQRVFEFCKPYTDTKRLIFYDETGAVRCYCFVSGSDDSSVTREYYYDNDGHICFALIKAAAANGTKVEYKIYFDTNGKRLWEVQNLLEGEGYTFPRIWPDGDIVYKPMEKFYSDNPCKEKH